MTEKPTPTRTTGPLHFEDLEPHRFEDLVRRLIYDFRPWRHLEATGRLGSDEGFDARGFEIITSGFTAPGDTDEDEAPAEDLPDRVWLIQCKREKSITPKKLGDYLDDVVPADETGKLYGIVFAAACDFSKAARDVFRTKTVELGFAEAYLWGRGELEDLLYQPKNDDVLFTYFGVSRRIRQRSLSAEVRRRLVVKRKFQRLLEATGGVGTEVLIRDASDDRYPNPDTSQADPVLARRWSVYRVDGCRHDGLHVLWHRHPAFIGDDSVAWDIAERADFAPPYKHPWRTEKNKQQVQITEEERNKVMEVWNALPEDNRAWFEEWLVLPYENVIDIDDKGDEWFDGPHIYVAEFDGELGPFRQYTYRKLQTIDRWSPRQAQMDANNRAKKFVREENDS